MMIGSGKEADFRDGCLSLRASTLAKVKESPSPGFSGSVPNGLGRQTLSTFRSEPTVGWGALTEGVKDKGRPVESATGKGTPGPQYALDRVTYGQQVQSRFKTAPTPCFGSSQRPPINGTGTVSPGPMTAVVNVNEPPAGPKYSMAGAPWRKETAAVQASPGPGQYSVCGALGEQKESTRQSRKGFVFGGGGVARDMALPAKEVPGPGHYPWYKSDRSLQPGVIFGSAPQRPSSRQEKQPGPCQYVIPSTMGPMPDSRFRTVVAPGFGTPPPEDRPKSAAARLISPGPGHYDVQKVDDISIARKPLSKERSCPSISIRPPSVASGKVSDPNREGRQEPFDPESMRRAVLLSGKGRRVPDVSFGVGPQRPIDSPEPGPGPQAYDPENIRRAVVASRPVATRGIKFGTGPQRHNIAASDRSPGPNAGYHVPSTLGTQANPLFKSVNVPSFGNASPQKSAAKSGGSPGPCSYNPTMAHRPATTRPISFGGTGGSRSGGSRQGDAGGSRRRSESSPGPGAYKLDSALGRQTSSKYKSLPATSFYAR